MKHFIGLLSIALLVLSSCTREHRVVEESYPNGKPKRVCIYLGSGDDRQILRETTYYACGNIQMDGTFKNNQRDGQWIYLYESGKKWSEGSFKNGKNEGKRTTYFENGQLRYEAYYKDGSRVGKWKFFDDKGNLVQEVDYDAAAKSGK
jgi:antitoxin component YwqK of YwqJK toxin-antitoxin module